MRRSGWMNGLVALTRWEGPTAPPRNAVVPLTCTALHVARGPPIPLDATAWGDFIGDHGIGKINGNGQRLLEFCSRYLLCVTNTYFKGKSLHKTSWKHPRSGHWHQLDLIVTRKRDLRDTHHTRSYHSAECDTDHSLVASRIAISPKKIHSSRPQGVKKVNFRNVKSGEMLMSFEAFVRSETASRDTNAPVYEEWLKVNEKRKAFLKYREHPCPNTEKEWRSSKAAFQRVARHCANAYWIEACRTIQACADVGDFGGIYSGIKRALGPVPKMTAPLKEVDGSVITDNCRQLARWVEHYIKLYSTPAHISPVAVQKLPKLPTWSELDVPPTIEELAKAVKRLKRGRSPGGDGVFAEILKLECIAPILHSLLWKCWKDPTLTFI
ncbi:unnamed protein product [Arctia plantaginis]|uniref:Uncharacterized protein n=1 Tax=Arctia plantaginis TaxID=874455 RepID=A0A8S1AEA3_ARCPL|nr:unnamed protein product [Arctia plantaginis]